MLTLYGIRNCDTMRKAMRWLEQHDIAFEMHDYRRDGLDAVQLRDWSARLGWETMINRRGTTWRGLDPKIRDRLDTESAIELMLEQPAIIRRPLLVHDDELLIGFDPARYAALLTG